MRLSSLNTADCDRKIGLEHCPNQHGVDYVFDTFLNPGQTFRLAKYICHMHRQSDSWSGIAIVIRHGIVQNSVPVPDLSHLEETDTQFMLAGKPVETLSAYISPSRPLIEADHIAYFGRGMPIQMPGT
jgi:hypothetical protein